MMIRKHLNALGLAAGVVAASFGATEPALPQAAVDCGEFDVGCKQLLPDATNDGPETGSSSLQVRTNQVCVDDLADAVTVTLDIEHTWIGDLLITLESPPAAVPVTLLNRLDNPDLQIEGGCDGNSRRVRFGDDGGPPGCFSYESSGDPVFSPVDGAMADLVAGTIDGRWRLYVTDAGTGNFGELRGWSLQFDCDTIEDDRVFGDSFETAP